MSQPVYSYIKNHFSDRPYEVDKLIVSAFFRAHNLGPVINDILNSYIIPETSSKLSQKVDEFKALIIAHFDEFNIETIIQLFEFVISPADKIITGAVYTPVKIRTFIVDQMIGDCKQITHDWKAADIACGCGGFLYSIAKKLKQHCKLSYKEIFENNIFGLDIKNYSVTRSKILLTILAIIEGEDNKSFKFNLFQGNALTFNWADKVKNFLGFSFIAGNPPYVCSKKIDEKTKGLLTRFEVCTTGHPDLYIPFFEIGIKLLGDNGKLGFITMNTFFKSLNGRALRAYFQKLKYSFNIIDFGTTQIFKKKNTYTCICSITKIPSNSIGFTRLSSIENLLLPLTYEIISYQKLDSRSGWNLHNYEILNLIESAGTAFSKKYKTRNGIATLKNDIYIFRPVDEDSQHYYLQNGKVYEIEKEICKDVVNPNYLGTSESLAKFTEKIIFPYRFENRKAKLFSRKEMSEKYPKAFKYLSDKRNILSERDKGKGNYEKWFAFGRRQSLEKMTFKLFFPHIAATTPSYEISDDPDLYFYNGIAVIGESIEELQILAKIMSSRVFWYYIKSSSKPYSADYFSLSKNYIKDFGICDLLPEEKKFVLDEKNQEALDQFFEQKYKLNSNTLYLKPYR